MNLLQNKIVTIGNELEDIELERFDHIWDVYDVFDRDFKKFRLSLDWEYFPQPNKPIISQYFNEACLEQGIKPPTKIKGYTFI